MNRFGIFLFALLCLFAARLCAQGGPPMITDDPGTPGDGHWEINTAWTDQRTPGATLAGAPLLDANYGVGERIELNYQGSWNRERDAGEPALSGLSDSQLAMKWRFYDGGGQGLQVSTFPRIIFLTPGSDSGRRGLADSHSAYFLPVEAEKDFGAFSVNGELGRTFSAWGGDRNLMAGLCLGREIAKGWEWDAEVHVTADDRAARSETIVNVGTRYDLGKHATILLAVGRDTRNTLGPEVSLLTYVGIQIRI